MWKNANVSVKSTYSVQNHTTIHIYKQYFVGTFVVPEPSQSTDTNYQNQCLQMFLSMLYLHFIFIF